MKISFELYPPHNSQSNTHNFELTLEVIRNLQPLQPEFFSITYGATGSKTRQSINLIDYLCNHNYAPYLAAHIVAVTQSRLETNKQIQSWQKQGVKKLVVLRGDASNDNIHPDCYQHTPEMILSIRQFFDDYIAVAAYPHKHPLSPNVTEDINNLKRKIDAGANAAITQFFFEPYSFLRFRDKIRQANINVPLVAGILPIYNFQNTVNFADKCQTAVPSKVKETFSNLPLSKHPEASHQHCFNLCRKLIDEGVDGLHFYTLNKYHLLSNIINDLNISPLRSSL